MKSLDRTRAEISAIVEGIEQIPAKIREIGHQPDDREAYDIIARIERKMLAQLSVTATDAAV